VNQKLRALTFGGGGTLGYYALILSSVVVFEHFKSDVGLLLAFVLFLPLFPSMIPGCLVSVLLAFLGVRGFSGFHDTGFTICPLISAPFVNSYIAYLWMRHHSAKAA